MADNLRARQAEIGSSGKATIAYLTLGTAIAIALVAICCLGTRALSEQERKTNARREPFSG